MRYLQIAICVDDNGVCSQLETWILEYQDDNGVKIDIDIYNTAEELFASLKDGKWVDIIFFDIELPGLSGLQVGRGIREKLGNDIVNIVFISGKTCYCKDLFDIQPLNFHEKPLKKLDIFQDLDKFVKKYNIFTSISFTATTLNYKEFPKVVSYAKKYKVDNVWSDRYIPLGDSEDKNLALNVSQTQEYLSIMAKERLKLKRKQYNKTTISMYRALQFQKTNDFAYGCTAGDTLLTVMENGDLVPCRRMPIVVGNLLKDDMYKLYKTNPILKKLRKNTIPDDCNDCEHAQMCHGGLKCITYAIYKDLNHKDIGCNL